jgi:uncharacterized protein YprB with RNaseH-like and TPR domain
MSDKTDKNIKKTWDSIKSEKGFSTKEKLEKLVNLNLKQDKIIKKKQTQIKETFSDEPVIIRDFFYPITSQFGKIELSQWFTISSKSVAIISGDNDFLNLDPMKFLYFDTETTGISGGTGTIPFMLGFGFFENDFFKIKIFVLNDLYKEEKFLEEIDEFLESHNFSATVTYNGKCFDFPLMETRYILYRKRFSLLKIPHLDFLFPARTIWKNTFESRKLGYLGDVLLGISRDEDIDGSQIPALYFNYLRNNRFFLIEKVIEHNALDLVGLSSLLLLGLRYVEDISFTNDEGEIFGVAIFYEKYGDLEKANKLYEVLKDSASRKDIISNSIKRLSAIKKKKKLYIEAAELWKILSNYSDHTAYKELSIYYEHREKNYFKAIEFVERGLEKIDLTKTQKRDMEKRLKRLQRKIKALEIEY